MSGGVRITSAVSRNPTVNLKIAGEHDIFPDSVIGTQSGDNVSVPGTIWFGNVMGPFVSTDISGEPPSVQPTVTIEITTDQGVVNP